MHIFQRLALEKICRRHGLDLQLIDDSLTYAENKSYLMSLVVKDIEDLLKNGLSQEEWYRKERFLTYYLSVRNT